MRKIYLLGLTAFISLSVNAQVFRQKGDTKDYTGTSLVLDSNVKYLRKGNNNIHFVHSTIVTEKIDFDKLDCEGLKYLFLTYIGAKNTNIVIDTNSIFYPKLKKYIKIE